VRKAFTCGIEQERGAGPAEAGRKEKKRSDGTWAEGSEPRVRFIQPGSPLITGVKLGGVSSTQRRKKGGSGQKISAHPSINQGLQVNH